MDDSILEDLLKGTLSPQIAMERMLSKTPLQESPDDDADVNMSLCHTWARLIPAASKFPEHHEKLAELLVLLSHSPPLKNDRGEDLIVYDMRVWTDLPRFGWELNSEWNGLTIPSQPGVERSEAITGYINVNKFVARLTTLPLPGKDFEIFCLWSMRDALETPLTEREPYATPIEVALPAAAEWVLIAGPQMYFWDLEYKHGPNRGRPGGGGPLWDGKHGFCKERWSVWKTQFGRLSETTAIGDELRAIARQAEARMDEIENGNV